MKIIFGSFIFIFNAFLFYTWSSHSAEKYDEAQTPRKEKFELGEILHYVRLNFVFVTEMYIMICSNANFCIK